MASNIKYPENSCRWFIEGDNFALLTNVDDSGNTTSSERKKWKAIQEAVTDGILLFYHGEPNKVTAITDTPDVDNSLHLSLVDYVKKQLYLDEAGTADDPNKSSVSINMSNLHQRRWDEAVKRFGARKRDKTGGTRAILPPDLT